MNIEVAYEQIKNKADELKKEITEIDNTIKHAVNRTNRFLRICAESGCTKVAIHTSHKSIPESTDFPFGPYESIFGNGEQNGWPAIWKAVDSSGYNGGCGNLNQKQSCDLAKKELIDGVYHLKAGRWYRI